MTVIFKRFCGEIKLKQTFVPCTQPQTVIRLIIYNGGNVDIVYSKVVRNIVDQVLIEMLQPTICSQPVTAIPVGLYIKGFPNAIEDLEFAGFFIEVLKPFPCTDE